jgi:hypothetical protein
MLFEARASTRCDPINPDPPVIRVFMTLVYVINIEVYVFSYGLLIFTTTILLPVRSWI